MRTHSLIKRALTLTVAISLCLGSMPFSASAQADSGKIVIDVVDSQTKAPLDMARVLLNGPVMTSEFSGPTGSVKFTDVPDGIYTARVFKRDYQAVTSEQFEVINGKTVTVSVSLAKSQQLRVIGTVTVHSTASISTTSVSDTSAQRRLSDTLADALNKLSGVSVTTSGSDTDATQTVSLEGHDPSQTALSLDGVPLNAPGSAGNLGQISTDLFRGASVSFGPQTGGLGGGVNFRTLEPTLSWQGTASLSAGSYGKGYWSFAETGSLGNLGIAVQHTSRSTPSLANGLRYLDASGLDYEHDGINDTQGDLVKLRYRLGPSQTLSATYLDTNQSNSLLCLQITGPLPCGYGPDNTIASRFSLYALTDSALIGQTAVQASIYQNSVKFDRDLLNRFLNGVPDPTGFLTDTTSKGFSVNATLPAKERHTISIAANSTSTTSNTTPLLSSGQPYVTGAQTSNYSSLTVNDSIRSNAKLKLNDHIGLSQASNSSSSLLAGVAATWTPTSADTYSAAYDIGGVAPHVGRIGVLSDPQSLRFDCNGDVAYGNAPGDLPSASSSTSARLGYAHSFANGLVSAQFYRQVQNGVVLPTQVNGTVLANALPPNYFETVQQVFQSPGGCNAANVPFGAQNVYFSVPIGGVQRVYEGAQLAANFNFGNLNVQPYYNITVAKANSSDPRIDNPYSIVISGAQLPNIPLHKAGVTLDYKFPHSIAEGLLSAQYVGSNNSQNLPAYTVIDAGVNLHLTHGDLTIAGNNLFNTYGGIFATNAGAVPYTTLGGQQIATIARPNSPRQFTVTWTVPFGASATAAANNGSNLVRQGVGEGQDRGFFIGGGGPPGGPGARVPIMLSPLPSTPPSDPFAMQTSNAMCTSDGQKTVQPFVDQLKAYVAKIEAAKTANGYPDSVPGAPQTTGVNVSYHKVGASYALSLEVQRREANLQALPACIAIHLAQPEDVQSRGLYQPKSSLFFRPSMEFMPAVGFYIARPVQQPGQQSFRLYQLPTSAPSAPFQVRASDACTTEIKSTAQRLLGELQAYFKSGKPAQSWKITPHSASGGTWYQLDNDDLSTLPTLLNCGRVAAATSDQIKAAGFDGSRPPTINYAAKLGLYIIRGAPPGANGTNNRSGAQQPPPGTQP